MRHAGNLVHPRIAQVADLAVVGQDLLDQVDLARIDHDDLGAMFVPITRCHMMGWAMQGFEPMKTSTSDSSKSA